MKIEGRFLDDVKTEKGLAFFKDMYETTPEQMMEDYDLNRVTMLTTKEVKYIVFIEPDSTHINMKFTLELEGDYAVVYAQEGLEECGVFNTDGIAFMGIYETGEKLKLFSIENSPYDLTEDDLEEVAEYEGLTVEEVLALVAPDATISNTKFVAQL